jgi:pimeloyl-ACP methyl ester carboxylesterase
MPQHRTAPPQRWRARRHGLVGALVGTAMALVASVASASPPHEDAVLAQDTALGATFTQGTVAVEGTTLHFVRGGTGAPLVLLHGWPETWAEWRPVMPALAANHTVIAFDLPGLGTSTIPAGGFDKTTTAKRIREGVRKLGFTGQVSILAHDMGSLVAYPYARDFPTEVARMAVLETPLSGFGLENFFGVSWHLGFNQTAAPVPETIMDNEDVPTFLGWLFSGAHHPDRIPQQFYFDAYSSPARRSAGYNYYRAFAGDAAENQAKAPANPLHMPVLAMGAEFAFGPFVGQSFSQVGTDVRSVIAPDSGHWISEENSTFLIDCAGLFFGPAGAPAPRPELTNCVA